jgi:hypothetical protein
VGWKSGYCTKNSFEATLNFNDESKSGSVNNGTGHGYENMGKNLPKKNQQYKL